MATENTHKENKPIPLEVKPLSGIVFLKIPEVKAGVLDTSSRMSAVEYAEVLDVGDGVSSVKKGDKVFVKAWAVDIITHNEVVYHFVNIETKGILAVVNG